VKSLQTLEGVEDLQQSLLLGSRHHQVGRQLIGELVGIVHLYGRDQSFKRQMVRHLGVGLEHTQNLVYVNLDVLVDRKVDVVGLDLGVNGPIDFLEVDKPSPFHALDHHLDVAVRQLEALDDARHHTNLVHVLARRFVDLWIFLCHQKDKLLGDSEALFQCLDRLVPTDNERRHHVRKHDHVAQRYQRQPLLRGFDEARAHTYNSCGVLAAVKRQPTESGCPIS
jgi:hypothetical protein